jgi:hypothetical protein
MRLSALNLSNKDKLSRAWDIHAQRLVECRDCHYAKTPPTHLLGGDTAATKNRSIDGLRTCGGCHADARGHAWLPEREKHFAAVACESCHVPKIHLPARKQLDASMLTPDGNYLVSYRGLAQGKPDDLGRAYIVGYRPMLLKRTGADGFQRWAPMNLISRWYWIDAATGREVNKEQLINALFADHRYRPEVIEALDKNGDGELETRELRLDANEKVERITALLTAQGVEKPMIEGEVRAYHVHHSVALRAATRDCELCHAHSKGQVFKLADYLPAGVVPTVLHGLSKEIMEQWRLAADGSFELAVSTPLSQIKPPTSKRH